MKRVSLIFYGLLCSILGAVPALAQPSLEAILADPVFYGADMSPSGRYIAGIRLDDRQERLIVVDLEKGGAGANMVGVGGAEINWIEWASDDRLMMSITAFFTPRGKRVSYKQMIEDPDVRAYGVTRLISINRDGTDSRIIFDKQRKFRRNFNLARITDFLRDDPAHIMMPARVGGDLDLFKVNILTGEYDRVAVGKPGTIGWYTDESGEPALRLDVNTRFTRFYFYAREAKQNGKYKWKRIKTVEIKRRRDDDEEQALFRPIFAGPDDNTYYVVARPEGADTSGIYLYNFEDEEYVEELATHPELDITRGLFDRESKQFLGHSYWDDRIVYEFKDELLQAHLTGLNSYFGDELNVSISDYSDDGKTWLIYASGPTDSGSWHHYDVEDTSAMEIGKRKRNLPIDQLAPMQIVDYEARDGVKLTGYLTRPVGAAEGDTPPLIVLPHGGPEIRDYFSYNTEVQMLAARGYQVFQPNFRGSSGYGRNFVEIGYGQWGQAMQDDIDDGYKHLVDAGLAEYGNACIFGASYGGYAALMGAMRATDEYKCAIATAGPSNLVKMLNWESRESGSTSETYKYWVKQIGHPRNDKQKLLAVSPEAHADEIDIPVLLIHGKNDNIVPYEESKRMNKALKKAGKDVTYIELKDSGHSWRPPEDAVLEINETLKFLAKHLPVN